MYFLDFLKKYESGSDGKYFLSGNSDFLKFYAVEFIAEDRNLKVHNVTHAKELDTGNNLGLFQRDVLTVLWPSFKSKFNITRNVIKLSQSKITKQYKDLGFVEVACSDLFPNQIATLVTRMAQDKNITLSSQNIKDLIRDHGSDLYSIHNALGCMQFIEISISDPSVLPRDWSLPGHYKIINAFIEGDFNEFMSLLENTGWAASEITWGLLNAIMRLYNIHMKGTAPQTWYEKKMYGRVEFFSQKRFDYIISYLSGLISDYQMTRTELIFKLAYLCYYLKGFNTGGYLVN